MGMDCGLGVGGADGRRRGAGNADSGGRLAVGGAARGRDGL